MNDQEFENLLADALGGELSAENVARFEAALAESPERRTEYDSALRAMEALQALPAADAAARGAALTNCFRTSLWHRYLWHRHLWHRRPAGENSRALAPVPQDLKQPLTMQPIRARGGSRAGRWLRYAAGLLIAFGAGYGVRAAGSAAGAPEAPAITESNGPHAVQPQQKASVQSALASAYRRNPGRSDLATCMRALFGHVD